MAPTHLGSSMVPAPTRAASREEGCKFRAYLLRLPCCACWAGQAAATAAASAAAAAQRSARQCQQHTVKASVQHSIAQHSMAYHTAPHRAVLGLVPPLPPPHHNQVALPPHACSWAVAARPRPSCPHRLHLLHLRRPQPAAAMEEGRSRQREGKQATAAKGSHRRRGRGSGGGGSGDCGAAKCSAGRMCSEAPHVQ